VSLSDCPAGKSLLTGIVQTNFHLNMEHKRHSSAGGNEQMIATKRLGQHLLECRVCKNQQKS
jgi:hypothetical protein